MTLSDFSLLQKQDFFAIFARFKRYFCAIFAIFQLKSVHCLIIGIMKGCIMVQDQCNAHFRRSNNVKINREENVIRGR